MKDKIIFYLKFIITDRCEGSLIQVWTGINSARTQNMGLISFLKYAPNELMTFEMRALNLHTVFKFQNDGKSLHVFSNYYTKSDRLTQKILLLFVAGIKNDFLCTKCLQVMK